MTSKAPAQVNKFADDSLEAVAYKIAEQFSTREFNDNNRLGYHIYRYLMGTIPTIDEAVRVSGVRLTNGETIESVATKVAQQLREMGKEIRRG
ncbi:MAG TPA: hypothetical protein VLX91_03020 [Candidatus Acidoferrales bacterium]|nr:hypothetical protein [Candidatus Acidoferrales bacterium]